MDEMVFINTTREGYTPSQCRDTLTVGELIEALESFPEDLPIYFSNDDGFTYGSINAELLEEGQNDD